METNGRPLSRDPRAALALLFAINLLNFFDRNLPGALAEPIRREFALSDTALGLVTTIFTLIYAAVGVPLSRVADRWIRTRLISIGVATWSLLTAATGLAWSYPALIAARLGVGVGEATCSPASQSLIGDFYPRDRRSRALGTFMLGLPIGLFASYLVGGYVGHALGWRTCFLLAAVPGLLLAWLVAKLREPARGATETVSTAAVEAGGSSIRRLLRIRTLWWIIASGALHNFNMYAITSFQTPLLQRYHHLSLSDANLVSALVLGAAGIAGLLGGGWAGDRLSTRRTDGRLLLAAGALLLAAPFVLFALMQPAGAIAAFMLPMAIGSVLVFVYYATVYAAIQDVVEPRLRSTAVGLYFFAMYVLGASFGPVGTGMLSDYFARHHMALAQATEMSEGFRALGLHDAMYVIPLIDIACGLVLWTAARAIRADFQR